MDELEIDTFASTVVRTEQVATEEIQEVAEESFVEEQDSAEDHGPMDENDTSFLCGRYLAVARKMEKQLAALGRYEGASLAEDLFDFFPSIPGKSLAVCQKQVVDSTIILKSLGRSELAEEMNEIFPLINVRSLQTKKLDMQLFIHGYHKQLSTITTSIEVATAIFEEPSADDEETSPVYEEPSAVYEETSPVYEELSADDEEPSADYHTI